MTTALRLINNYIDQNFIRGSVKREFLNDNTVKITDKQGKSLSLTTNTAGDILDANTMNILAERIKTTSWMNYPWPGKANAPEEQSIKAKLSFYQSRQEKEQKKNEILRKNERNV